MSNTECAARYRARHLPEVRERQRLAAQAKRERLPEYAPWQNMIARCSDPENADYGGRDITVCARWRNSFAAFLADMGPRPSARHTIEREDNDGNYTPNNCVWATRKVQAENTRRNLTVLGRPLSVILGEVDTTLYNRVRMRLYRGWSEDRALGGINV